MVVKTQANYNESPYFQRDKMWNSADGMLTKTTLVDMNEVYTCISKIQFQSDVGNNSTFSICM